jgi:hypothetical protein
MAIGGQFGKIVLAIKQQLVDYELTVGGTDDAVILPATAIKIVARDQVPKFTADRDVLIRVGRLSVLSGTVQGAGRVATRAQRMVSVTPRTRLSLDESDRDEEWLTNATLGHFLLEEQIIDALHLFFPLDANGVAPFLVEPMRLMEGDQPGRDRQMPQMFGDTSLVYECVYMVTLDQEMQ